MKNFGKSPLEKAYDTHRILQILLKNNRGTVKGGICRLECPECLFIFNYPQIPPPGMMRCPNCLKIQYGYDFEKVPDDQ